jgi:hypothetical protein
MKRTLTKVFNKGCQSSYKRIFATAARLTTLCVLCALCMPTNLQAQKAPKTNNLIYIDKQGVIRWTKGNAEASFFGVNYTTPFAYAYRAHKALNVDLEKAIRQDVYHMARIGLDAFRVHVWDTEISDTSGNLIDNDHLRLFDYLLAELKKRNIKTIITPIAFWGNGYPERDEMTPGFARKYGKGRSTSNDTAIKAQENYLQQFFKHVNPYTKLTYGNDPDVVAVELNNEPSHSGPKPGVTNYINRLATAVKSTGWIKPLFYNISQSPYYADAVAASDVNGFSFQWYPSGLVANQEQKGNFLPNVDKYNIPFDTIPAFAKKALMVYEFDAADVLQSCMYPAIARSFRGAGFQWATQFAYDPMALGYANTEYQTHYLNLAYTPSKAISALIASEVFHRVPRLKSYGTYPADSAFDVFRVSYKESLSEMNAEQKFYYSNNTSSKPVNVAKLTNIAGVGSSAIVHYQGTGAYFLDKMEDGAWRLEVMPDAIHIRDPFERASPSKEVTRIQWSANPMRITLPDLGQVFSVRGLNEGNTYSVITTAESFDIRPGTYLLVRNGKATTPGKSTGVIGMNEFEAPQPFSKELFLQHEPFTEVSAGKSFIVSAKVVGIDNGKALLQVTRFGGGQPRVIPMTQKTTSLVEAEIPADLVIPGVLSYRIIIQKGDDYTSYPGAIKGSPFAWNSYSNETWKTYIAAENGRLEIFNPTTDRNARIYPGFRRNFQTAYTTGEMPGQLILRLSSTELSGDHIMGFQYFFGDKIKGRNPEAGSYVKLVIRARATGTQPLKAKVTLTNADAVSVSSFITITDQFQDIEVPLNELRADSALMLPRPYPGFQSLWFKGSGPATPFKWQEAEKIELTIGSDILPVAFNKPYGLEVASIWFQKK